MSKEPTIQDPTIQERLRKRATPDKSYYDYSITEHEPDGGCVPGYDAELDLREADEIDELKKEIEHRDGFIECDGCSTGDCPHDSDRMCIVAQGKIIAEQSAVIQRIGSGDEFPTFRPIFGRLIGLLKPFAKIADAFDDDSLYEHRASQYTHYTDDERRELSIIEEKAGKTIITLGDCLDAREAVNDAN